MGRLRTPWTSQPKFLTGLSSEFARPTFAFNAATGLVDIVANAAITKSNVTTKPSIAGVGLQTTATGTNDGIYTLSSLAADTTPFSVLIVVKIGAVSGDVGLFQWAGSTGATGSPHALIKNTTGNLQIYGASSGYVATQTGVLTAGSVHSIVLTFDGAKAYLCRNGQMTSAVGPWIGAGAVKTHAWFDNGFNTVDTGNAVYAGAIWSGKALSVAKALALSRNPWQVFQPLARNVYFGVPAAGGSTTITCSVASASSIGVSAQIPITLQSAIGAASAVGVAASVNTTIQTSVASAAATGVSSLLSVSVIAGPGVASATGVTAGIAVSGNTTITCSVAASAAVGVSALVNKTLQASVGAAVATGVTANIFVGGSIVCTVGSAGASGVTAQLHRIFGTTVGNAIAAGTQAAVGVAGLDVLGADRFDYRRALRIPNAYAPDPAIARMGQRMTRRNRW